VAAVAVRVVDPAVVLAVPVVRAADLAATVGLAAARRVVIRIVRNAPIARSPNECSGATRELSTATFVRV